MLDSINRISRVIRQSPTGFGRIMEANYTYLANGLVSSVTYPTNGAKTKYTYDVANRLSSIDHLDGPDPGISALKMVYTYLDNNLIASITESNSIGGLAGVAFTYDARGRLTREVRSDINAGAAYDFTYEYDQGGNRTMKISPLSGLGGLRREVRYGYDVNPPANNPDGYVTWNNRLMKVETFDITDGGGTSENFTGPDSTTSSMTTSLSDPTLQDATLSGSTLLDSTTSSARAPAPPAPPAEIETLVSRSWYYYNLSGNVQRVVTNQANSFGVPTQAYSATRMGYAQNGQAVTFAVGETWNWTGDPAVAPTGYDVTYVREFRYEGDRARYLVRKLDAQDFEGGTYTEAIGGDTWTDYDGDTAYGDFDFIPGGIDPQGEIIPADGAILRSYEPGIGLVEGFNTANGTSTSYYMADHLGTTRGMTDPNGAAVESASFTAFGERAGGSARRYGYVGAWGYQTATSETPGDAYADFPFQHVGARFYDPASGRFMQRDPIGILGGVNVYAYVGNRPITGVDPDGLQEPAGKIVSHVGGAVAGGTAGLFALYVLGISTGGPVGILVVGGCMALGYDLGGNAYDDITNPTPPYPSGPGYREERYSQDDCRRCHARPGPPG